MSPSQKGSLLAIACFVLWGLFPFYFKAVSHISSLEVLANRVIWSTLFLVFIIFLLKRWHYIRAIFCNSRQLLYLFLSMLLISTNWGVYIWAVATDNIFEASLGYYINPLLNIFLGFVLLKEQLRTLQWLAVTLAAIGVGVQVFALGKIPWIALVLAISFGLYGFMHKKLNADSFSSLFIETLLLSPVAIIFLAVLGFDHSGPTAWRYEDWLLLMAAGPVTVIPLLLFTAAAKRINYSSIGFFQYITPSILFLLALFYYKEPFSFISLIAFVFIWLALILVSFDVLKFQYFRPK